MRSGDSRRFEGGDGIRGLLALAVFNLHAAIAALAWTGHADLIGAGAADLTAPYGDPLGALLSTGVTAVPVFFVLSGYLVGRPFVTALVADRPPPQLGRYVVNRLLRVVPAYWLVLIAVAVVAAIHGAPLDGLTQLIVFDVEPLDPLNVWIGQAWTLEVEMKFYLALPLAFLAFSLLLRPLVRNARVALLAALCGGAIVVVPLVDPVAPGLLRSFAAQLPYFGAGLALAVVEPSLRPRIAGRRQVRLAATALTAVGLGVLLAGPLLADAVGQLELSELLRRLAIGAVVGGPLVAEWVGGGTWWLLDNRLVRWLGTRSYSFYLVQLLTINELGTGFAELGDGYKVTLLWLYPLALAATVVAAEALYLVAERPYLRRRRGDRPAPGEGTAATPAQAAP
jgi:peptidoglycan/LPS O-acetylase OafA/YrhL